MHETKMRSVFKALSWRFVATLITFSIALLLTRGNMVIALEIGFLDLIFKLFVYFLHERIWGYIKLGKKAHPLEDIKIKGDLDKKDKEIIRKKLKELGYLDE